MGFFCGLTLSTKTVYSLARQGKGGIRSGRVDSDLRKGFGLGFAARLLGLIRYFPGSH